MIKYKEFPLIDPLTCYIENVVTLKTTSLVTNKSIYDVVGATSKNNGNVGFYNKKELLVKGNCICLIKTGEGSVGEAVYKYGNFIPSNNVSVIRSKYLNKYIGLYLVATINKNASRYNYGYIRNEKRILKEKIILPINLKGKPDYEFMEAYMREKEEKLKSQYKEFISSKLNKKYLKPQKLATWKKFAIEDLFEISKGIYLHSSKIKEGNNPYITAKSTDNGVNQFIGNQCIFSGNKITIEKVNFSSFYQPKAFYCSHDVSVINNKSINKYNSLFICNILNRYKHKYSYGRQAQMNIVKNETVLLPCTAEGNPDYKYMEKYMKYLEQQKLLEYFKFLEKE